MALKKSKASKKAKPAKGGSVKMKTVSKKSTKVKAAKPAKGAKTSKLKKIGKSAGGILDRAMGAYTGSTLADITGDYKGKTARVGGRRRKGVVPKTVRKWASKITRRRKQEEKIVKKLFGAEGGKIVKKAKPSRYGSAGVITKAEALQALRS